MLGSSKAKAVPDFLKWRHLGSFMDKSTVTQNDLVPECGP